MNITDSSIFEIEDRRFEKKEGAPKVTVDDHSQTAARKTLITFSKYVFKNQGCHFQKIVRETGKFWWQDRKLFLIARK